MILAGLQREIGWHQNRFRPHGAQRGIKLREAHIITDGAGKTDAARFKQRQIAPTAVKRAFTIPCAIGRGDVEQMDLAIARNLGAIRAENQRGIEQLLATIFDHGTAMHGNAVLARQAAQQLVSRATFSTRRGQHFGGGHAGIPPTAQIGPGFRQADQAGPISGNRRFDQPLGLRQIGRLIAALVHLDHADAHPPAPHYLIPPSSRGGGLPARGQHYQPRGGRQSSLGSARRSRKGGWL